MAFLAGYDKQAKFFLTSGSNTALNITGHSWEEAVDKLDVTHTGTAGQQALIAGVLRGDGNVKANYDSAALPHATAPGIKAGAKGVMSFYLGSPNTPFLVPCLITKVHYQSEVAGKVEYSFDVSLDSLSGTYTYPT